MIHRRESFHVIGQKKHQNKDKLHPFFPQKKKEKEKEKERKGPHNL